MLGRRAADHWDHREDTGYYSQPRALFRLMNAAQQKALFDNTARAMGDADPAYGKGVAKALGIYSRARDEPALAPRTVAPRQRLLCRLL